LVSTGGGSAHLGGASAIAPGATAHSGRRGGERGRHSFRPTRAYGNARVGAASGATARRWGRGVVAMWRVLIGSFEFKFDDLNMNLSV
jgi:hypothetical protein